MAKQVWVGISGGVDSAAAAILLKKQGYDVVGITLKLLKQNSVVQTIESASNVCKQLDIPHHILDLTQEFENKVVDEFVNSYLSGQTPNPCVQCNRKIKFGTLLDYAKENGADYIATGHYVRSGYDEKLNRHLLYKANTSKDQSYFLYCLTQNQIENSIFPLEKYDKTQVRQIAQHANLEVASRGDSMEICFIPETAQRGNHVEFIETHTKNKLEPGWFVDSQGKKLGKHDGIARYTIGQRKGLGLSFAKPMYVTEISAHKNEIVLGPSQELLKDSLIAENVNCVAWTQIPQTPTRVKAKIRYQAPEVSATVSKINKTDVRVEFDSVVRAVAPGQSVVFYDDDVVLGGGIIK